MQNVRMDTETDLKVGSDIITIMLLIRKALGFNIKALNASLSICNKNTRGAKLHIFGNHYHLQQIKRIMWQFKSAKLGFINEARLIKALKVNGVG